MPRRPCANSPNARPSRPWLSRITPRCPSAARSRVSTGRHGRWPIAPSTSSFSPAKANTYISPKDDPHACDRWRKAYPAATLKALGKLAATAQRNHVDFVYAISPGPSVCFSDPADAKALLRKFDAFRALGVRSFYVALDDIEYTKWNCARDKTAFGASGAQAAGVAQAHLLNLVQADLVARHGRASRRRPTRG